MQSDLEEGEIPEFEVPPYVSARNRRGMLLGSRKVHSFTPLNAHDRIKKGSKRYGSPPSEDEYIYEEEQLPRKNTILQKHLYNNNLMGKAPKNLHPVQPTYGSVEVIMSKIGESLGRRSDYYYKERRPKESRYLVAINDSRNINSVLRKTSPVFTRLEYDHYNKRRYSETNSESVNSIREKYGKIKSKKSFDARRSGRDVRIRKKRKKRKHSEISEGSMDKVDKFKKLRLFEQKDKGTSGHNKKLRKHGLKSLVFKEIPLPQEPEREPEPQEKNVKEVQNSEHLNCLDNSQDSLPHIVKESNLADPPSVVLNGNSAMINSTDKPEQLNNEDDDDDDDDLIRLRLLALTSNKKKSQSFTNNCLDTAKDLGKSSEENITTSKSNVADDEKIQDNPSSSNDETVKKSGLDNEIDRYELFLRAEALKTALLKKHQRILKKRKTFNAISRNTEGTKSENSDRNDLVKGNEIDIDIISDEELREKNLDGDSNAQVEVAENYKKLEIKDENKYDSESGKEDKVIDIHEKRGLQSENFVTAVETGHSEKSSTSAESGTLELDKALNDVDINVKNASAGPQSLKKKAKKIRQKQSKKWDLNETNITKNNVSCENKDICQKTKFGYSLSSSDKNKADLGKNLVDTVASSNPEINAACIACNSQSCLDVKQNHKSIISQKVAVLNNEEPAAKIPESERIIVHLGSDDSSDEECIPNIEPDKKFCTVANNESEKVNPLVSVTHENNLKEFEKSVDLLLKGARRKLENSAEVISQIPATPEAVYSHLAPSQRLEYMRLKQKIAEREKSGKVGKNNLNNPSSAGTNKSRANSNEDKIITPITTPRNIGKRPIFGQNVGDNNKALNFKNRVTHKEVINPPDKNYAIRTPSYGGLGNSESVRINQFSNIKKPVPELNSQRESASTLKKDFTDSNSKNAIKKGSAEIIERKKMLNQNRLHLERLKILWKNIKIEKMVEAKYEKEINKLKIQQNFFEQKVNQQRLKIKRMADESKQIYEAFQKNNKKVEVYSKRKRIVGKAENEGKKTEDSNKPTTEKNDAKDKEIGNDVKEKEIGKDVAKELEIGKEAAKDKEIGNEAAKDKEIGNDVAEDKEIGNEAAKDKEIGNDVAEDKEIGNEAAKDKEIGNEAAKDKEIGNDVAKDNEIGNDVAKELEIRKEAAKDKEIGNDVAKDKEIGNDVKEKEIGKDVAKELEIGNEAAKDKEIGNEAAKDNEIGNDVAKELEIGNEAAKDKEIGNDVVKDNEIGNDVEKGKDIAIVIPSAIENDVRLIAEDTRIGVNEKREEIETKAEEKVDNEKKSDTKMAVTVPDKDWVKEYKSPLENLTKRSESSDCPRIDPNVIMCQYDLLGKCNDEECVFQHWRA